VILSKLCVCYVISAECVKVGGGYRLVLSVEGSGEWIPSGAVSRRFRGVDTVWRCQYKVPGSGYRLVLSVQGSGKWIPSVCCLSKVPRVP
jgi:hypothetical protein